MIKYAALLRGIGPGNPNMQNDKLRGVFEDLGFQDVKTVISSGNVLFSSSAKNVKKLEELIEKALPENLGFNSTTIIKSEEDLKKLAGLNPFKGMEHTAKTSLNVTFLKNDPATTIKFPIRSEKGDYKVLGLFCNAICSVVDLTTGKTPNLMSWLEKEFGKQITTRTWKTVEKILKAMA